MHNLGAGLGTSDMGTYKSQCRECCPYVCGNKLFEAGPQMSETEYGDMTHTPLG
jgi:hypothetical protein